MRDCEIDVKDSMIVKENLESIDCAVTIKEEEYALQTAITLNTCDVPQNLLITGIVPNAIKIKSEPSDQDNIIENRIEMTIDANTDIVDPPQNVSSNEIEPNAIKNKSAPNKQDNAIENHIETSMKYKKPHKYLIYNKRFITKRCLLTYTNAHTSKKCNICNRIVSGNQTLLQQIEIHSDDGNFTCETCNNAHANDKTYKCDTCNICFATNGNLRRHLKSHNGERNHKCEICTKRFTTRHYLLQHTNAHTKIEKNHKCRTCGKCFAAKEYLTRHLKTHVGEKNFKCETCGKSFLTSRYVLKHMQTHTGERNYECTICKKRFRRKENVKNHMKIHSHENDDKIYGWSFRKRKITSGRTITHREESGDEVTHNFQCVVPTITPEDINETGNTVIKEEIGAYVKKNDLESDNHETEIDVKDSMITAQKLESINYDVTIKEECDASVPSMTLDAIDTSQNVSNIEIVPNGIEIKSDASKLNNVNENGIETSIDSTKYKKTHECEICNKRFVMKYYLLTHIKTHIHKNFKCDFCNKSFATNQNLLRHVQTHTGERNSKCEICNRCFATKYNMLQHMKVHDDEENYKCEICGECFTTNKLMSRHRRLHARG